MLNRRRLLSLLAAAPILPYVPKKTYSFLGGILRPRTEIITRPALHEHIDQQMVWLVSWGSSQVLGIYPPLARYGITYDYRDDDLS
jgi:hypothetical protein